MCLKAIVDECCQKWSLDNPEMYGLKLNKKDIDLSLSLRFANISAGSKLQLVPKGVIKTAQVNVALQMEQERLVDKFMADTTLWGLLVTFEKKYGISLTSRTGMAPTTKTGIAKAFHVPKAVYMMPVLIFMNKEYATIPDLKSNTLESIGLGSGSGVLRLLYKYMEDVSSYAEEITMDYQVGGGVSASTVPAVKEVAVTAQPEALPKMEAKQDSLQIDKPENAMSVDQPLTNAVPSNALPAAAKTHPIEIKQETNESPMPSDGSASAMQIDQPTSMQMEPSSSKHSIPADIGSSSSLEKHVLSSNPVAKHQILPPTII
jgi:TUG ubiquitin-like domain